MNANAHPKLLLGARSLDLLDADELRALDAHLADCDDCRAECAALTETVDRLRSVPADMMAAGRARGRPTAGGQQNGDLLLARTLRAVRRERAAGRLQRVATIAASIVLLAAVAAGTGIRVGSRSDVRTVEATNGRTGVAVSAAVRPQRGWVHVDLAVAGVPAGTTCTLIAVTDDGAREIAGSWVVSEAAAGGTQLSGAVAVPIDELAGLEITTADGERLVSVSI